MQSDLKQLTNVLQNVSKTTLSTLGLKVHFTNNLADDRYRWETYCRRLNQFNTSLPVGTMVRLADIEALHPTAYVLMLVGLTSVGNLVIYVDKVRFELEQQPRQKLTPSPVRCLSISTPPVQSVASKVIQILRGYAHFVGDPHTHRMNKGEFDYTLLTMLFEFAITNKLSLQTQSDI